MNEPWTELLSAAIGAVAGIIGAWLVFRGKSAEVKALSKESNDTAQDKLIDQLQEELKRYRDDNDKRVQRLEIKVATLESENGRYRAFIGVHRDVLAEHGVPAPLWPEDLPR